MVRAVGIEGQRLLADDHLAGLGRRHRHLGVDVVRHADVDDVDGVVVDDLAPVRDERFEAPGVGERLGLVRLQATRHLQHGVVRDVEKILHPTIGVGVRPPHEPVPDDADVQWLGHCACS